VLGEFGVLVDEPFDAVAAEWAAVAGREQRVVRVAGVLGLPGS